jgi:hypothetical protein
MRRRLLSHHSPRELDTRKGCIRERVQLGERQSKGSLNRFRINKMDSKVYSTCSSTEGKRVGWPERTIESSPEAGSLITWV